MNPTLNQPKEKETYPSLLGSVESFATSCCFRNILKSPFPFPRKRLLNTIIIPTPTEIEKSAILNIGGNTSDPAKSKGAQEG